MKEQKSFQTESKQLLDLMINSIYSNKEIFLREILSNASDAIDKYKYLSLTQPEKYPLRNHLIRIVVNKEERYIEVKDNGIGMNKEELETNLGTIAKSGSKEFLAQHKEELKDKDANIIGQFGVGFYSAFMVGKRIEVTTKKEGESAYRFSSDGVEMYEIEDIDSSEVGTSVRVYLKDDEEDIKYSEYLEYYKIESLVNKYSDYIRYPIKMEETHVEHEYDKDGKVIEGKDKTTVEDKTLNTMIPLWKKPKKDVSDEMLHEFFKNKFNGNEDPFLSLYVKAEGMYCYDALLFIPSHPPYDLYSENYEKGLALYTKGIFIQEKCKELIPDYLKFVKGLCDCDDFPLNISREILQKSPILTKIASNLENKIIDKLKEMKKEDRERYDKFFNTYGNYIKYGIYSSYGMKKDLLEDLLLFHSYKEDKLISLEEYVSSMDKDDKTIYYASGKSLNEIKLLPQLEKYKKNGKDVLLLDESIDEFTLISMFNYKEKEFKNIASESKEDLSKEEKDKIDSLTSEHKRTLDEIKKGLEGKVDDVIFSDKLVDSPVCISTRNGLSLNMERVLENQPGAKEDEENAPKAEKVLEINAEHDLFKAISSLKDDKEIQEYGALLYDEALLLEGYEVKDKNEFVKRLNDLMIKSIH